MSDLDDRLASLSPERRALLEEMMARQASAEPARLPERPRLEPAPGERHRPFPLTPAQQAFWIGRSGLYDLGGGGANSYMEYEFSNAGAAFIDRLEWAFQEFVERHDMMRAVVLADGRQQVLDEVLPIRISRINLRGKPEPEAEAALAESRERLRSDPGRLAEWPLFDLVAFYLDGDRVRLQLRFEALLKDGRSRGLLIDELPALFADPDAALEPIGITYRDFAVATEALPDGALHRRCRDYWAERWDDLPPGPLLPLVADLGPSSVARQTSRAGVLLETEAWRQLRQRAARMGLSASGVVLAAFVEVVTAFSEEPRFTLAVLSMGRPELHDDLDQVFGNFNTFVPLACDRGGGTFAERARRLQRQLGDHLEHGHFSGPEILREINRRRPSSMARWPVVFNSVLDTSRAEPIFDPEGEVWTDPSVVGDEGDSGDGGIRMTEIEGSVHTPQSLLTLTAMEAGDDLHGRWASFDEALPPGLVDAMDGALRSLLETLAESEGPWRLAVPPLQIAARGAEPVETADALGALREALGDDLVGPVAILAAPGSALAMVAEALVRAAGLELAPGPAAARLVFAQPARVGELFAGDDVAGSPIARVVLGDGEIPLGLPRRLARRLGATVSWLAPLSPSVALWNPDLAAALTDDAVRLERGRPLGGRLRVSDAAGRERPDRVPGRLEVKPPDGPAVETGWLALRHPDGEIELLGSSESHRLELAGGRRVERRRVEAVLERQEGVAGAAVVAREDGDGRRRAVAFVTATDGADLDPDQLAGALSEGLPPALRPSAVEVVETLPLDARGRVDRAALARRAQADAASAPTPRPPEGELETELAGLWEKLLGERPASVTDSLFDLGGTSLTLARLQALLAERYGTDVPLAAFFDRPTLGHLAEMVEERRAQMAAARRAVGPLTWLRRRLAGEPAPAATAAATPGLATPPVEPPSPRAPRAPRATRSTGTALDDLSPGMRTFLLIWAGQFVSILGTGLGSFAMGVWIFEQTQSATMFALMAALGATVSLLLSPISGLVVDRFDRRWVMILADTGAATMTLLMAYLWFTDSMQVWMIYPILACMVSFSIFQGPALVASVSLLVPRRDLARASGMSQTAAATAGILSPLAAGALIGLIGYHGVVLIDFATFLVGVTILLFVRIPRPPASAVTEGEHRSLWRDALFGWTYLRERRGLFDLVSLFGLNNFGLAFVTVLLTPLILSFASTADLGVVQGAAAFGLLSGGLLLSVWGGPQRRMPALFAAIVFQGLVLLLAGFQPSVALIAFAAALFSFATPFIGGFSQAIFQSKVHLDVQGRVFAMRQVIAVAATPIAYTMAGPLADDVFEPLMAEGGALASSIGRVIGVGDGRGFALLILAVGVMLLVTSALFVLRPRLRRVETELPDVVGGTDDGDAPEPEPAGAPG